MASSSTAAPGIFLGEPPSDKLTRENYTLWRAQVLPAIRGAQLVDLLEGVEAAPPKQITVEATDKDKEPSEVPNPTYGSWLARDQILLSYLLKSLSREVLTHVHRIEHSAGIWCAVEEMFAAQHQSKITNLRVALANTKKLSMTTPAFLAKMQSIADDLAAAGRPVPDDEMVSYILVGLGSGYNSLVAAIGLIRGKLTLREMNAATIGVMTGAKIAAMIVLAKDVEVVAVPKTLEEGVAVVADVAAQHPGLTQRVKSATKSAMPPRIAGGDSLMMMMTPMATKK
ncbi:hypothetical protein QYE76_065517 [Lolium multiflorum]|uniref:Uncharacterized protein n=1 Tax=Lolium multiflorum TaxID=4521 RepID=A0AAD8SB41_LOLMU|nr:hypothetical protein QYE76_065517 [Lolium multiflorum]